MALTTRGLLLQAMKAFDMQFGHYDLAKNDYVLDPSWLSLVNSLNYISFGTGMFSFVCYIVPTLKLCNQLHLGVLIGSEVSARFG